MSWLLLVVYLLGAVVVGVLVARMDTADTDSFMDVFLTGVAAVGWPVFAFVCAPVVALWALGWLVSRLARTIPGRNNR